jgi:hypothetical protein
MNTAICPEVIVKAVPVLGDVSGISYDFLAEQGNLMSDMTNACLKAMQAAGLMEQMRSKRLCCRRQGESVTAELLDDKAFQTIALPI